jgi:hypothetical protein
VQAVTSSGNARRQMTGTINIEANERADATIDSPLVLRSPSRFGGWGIFRVANPSLTGPRRDVPIRLTFVVAKAARNARGQREVGGARSKTERRPYTPDWRYGLLYAQAAPRLPGAMPPVSKLPRSGICWRLRGRLRLDRSMAASRRSTAAAYLPFGVAAFPLPA